LCHFLATSDSSTNNDSDKRLIILLLCSCFCTHFMNKSTVPKIFHIFRLMIKFCLYTTCFFPAVLRYFLLFSTKGFKFLLQTYHCYHH
jgi:hypothetical protein